MTRARSLFPVIVIALTSSKLAAQRIDVTSAVFFETYSFDAGLVFDRVTQFAVPVGVNVWLGRYGSLALSSGFVSTQVKSADPSFGDQDLSGVLDTEVRYSYDVIPGRLLVLASGTFPTGIKTVERNELAVLGAISSDIIGFAVSNVGSGGNVGGGFVGAIPLGQYALGIGATIREPFSYTAVVGDPTKLKPGTDIRVRAGFEGPIARRTYIRLAGVFAHRQNDALGDSTLNGVGPRIISYLSINQGIGNSSLTVYGFDVYRGSPQLEPTAVGAAVLPRGNLIAAGVRFAMSLRRGTTITPRAEFRLSTQGSGADGSGKLLLAGESARFGADFRHGLSRQFNVVVQADGAFGFVVQNREHINFRGFRVALHGEFTP